MFGVAKRFWIPMVIVIVVAVAAVTVSRLHSVFGSHQHAPDTGNLDPIIAFYPKHVLYEVFGPPGTVASINYLDADAQPHEVVNAAVPWSFTIVTTLTAVVANVVARGDGASLGCRITVNDGEPPRHVRRLQFLERMGSCQVVHRGGTRRSCVSGRCGWSQRSAVSTIRSGQRSVRSPVYLVLAARKTVRKWVRQAQVDAGARPRDHDRRIR
ncbi:membrane protein mmpS1 [Mycobacterium tuberculosis C]|nr:membrane protein mmpS1 [Mycobacterium tuberculosis C]